MTQRHLDNAICKSDPESLEKPGVFDVVVIGAGAAGGLAAECLTLGGLKVLLLDAGFRPPFHQAPFRRLFAETVSRIANPNILPFLPPSFLNIGRRTLRLAGRIRQPIQTKCYAWNRRPDAFVDDFDCPYTTPPDRPFSWIRARALMGRVGIPGHGRQYFRLGRDDFQPSDGESPIWPFTPEEIDPWYAKVEKRLGLAGAYDKLAWLPDSELAHLLTPTASESAFIERVTARWPGFRPVLGRFAPPADTLEVAASLGRLVLRQGAIVRELDVNNGRIEGVRWYDQISQSERKVSAPLVFLCASALESTRILLLSKDSANGRPLGSHSNSLGHYLMDHVLIHAEGTGKSLPSGPVRYEDGGRCVYLPRFDARENGSPKPGRGFGVQVYQFDLAQKRSFFNALAFSEMLPQFQNRVSLNKNRVDRWGIPVLHINCSLGARELKRVKDQTVALRDLAGAAGISISQIDETPAPPGRAVHECGTARMGIDPASSVLDPNNQCWDAKGLYVTDSSSFVSQGSQNPTLTIMALTARACDHALKTK